MSCSMNRKAMTEGRGNYGIMPAITSCDRRHAIKDTTPLTREQIARIPGVYFPQKALPQQVILPEKEEAQQPKPERRPWSAIAPIELEHIRRLYRRKMPIRDIAASVNRERSTVRQALIRVGDHKPAYKSRIRGEHLAAMHGGTA